MNKGILSLLCISLIVAAQCESFMRIPFENGRVSSRSLAALNQAAFTTLHPNNTAVAVTLPAGFKTLNNIDDKTVTDFLIAISSSYSGVFNKYDKDFVSLTCDANNCANAGSYLSTSNNNPFFSVRGERSNIHMQIKSGDNVAWELQDQLALYISNPTSTTTQSWADYVISPGAYGYIGLGTDKGADKNFKTDLPIFSVKTSRTRTGSIVFGNDGTSTKNPVKLTADKNWRVAYDTAKLGDTTVKIDSNKLGFITFDLNVDGIVVYTDWVTLLNQFSIKYKFTSESSKLFGQYSLSYSGSPSDLPDLIISVGDKQVLKITPTQYLRYDASTKKFALLIQARSYYNDDASGTFVSPLVLGNQYMAQFYTVFEQTKDGTGNPVNTVTLNETPINDYSSGGSSSGGKGWIIGVVAVVGLAAVGYIVFKNKAANKLSEHLNPK